MTDTTSRELIVPDPVSGEAIDLAQLATDQVIEFHQRAGDLIGTIVDVVATAEGELIGRLDRAATWTHRTPILDGRQVEISAPSPDAGTTYHRGDELRDALQKLVDAGVLDPAARDAAVKRTLTVIVEGDTPEAQRLAKYASKLVGAKVDVDLKPVKAGIAKLRKTGIPEVLAAVDETERTNEPPQRRLKVKVLDVAQEKRR
jgi:hypothetical protein